MKRDEAGDVCGAALCAHVRDLPSSVSYCVCGRGRTHLEPLLWHDNVRVRKREMMLSSVGTALSILSRLNLSKGEVLWSFFPQVYHIDWHQSSLSYCNTDPVMTLLIWTWRGNLGLVCRCIMYGHMYGPNPIGPCSRDFLVTWLIPYFIWGWKTKYVKLALNRKPHWSLLYLCSLSLSCLFPDLTLWPLCKPHDAIWQPGVFRLRLVYLHRDPGVPSIQRHHGWAHPPCVFAAACVHTYLG